jgi:hypothetical protein
MRTPTKNGTGDMNRRAEMLLRRLIWEVTHPAIDRTKAQAAANNSAPAAVPANQKPGEAQPVAPTKVSSAKTSSELKGYRVASGSKKGTAIGHEGGLTTVKWDDGTTTQEQGTAIKDLREYLRLCVERMDSLVVDLEQPGGGSDHPRVRRSGELQFELDDFDHSLC